MKLASTELKNQIQLGRDLARAKEYHKAEKIFVDILKTHNLADVHNLLGLCYADNGEFKAAEYCFQKAISINPNYMEAALNLSVLYNNLGFGKKSKEIYKKLKKYGASGRGAMDPLLMSKISNLFGEIGDLFHGVGEHKDAIKAYEAAVDLCPSYLDLQTKLAVSYRESGQTSKALQVFKKIQKKAGKYAPYWVALGVTLYASNKPVEAKRAWTKALSVEPNNPSAKAFLKLDLSKPKTMAKKKKKASKKKK